MAGEMEFKYVIGIAMEAVFRDYRRAPDEFPFGKCCWVEIDTARLADMVMDMAVS